MAVKDGVQILKQNDRRAKKRLDLAYEMAYYIEHAKLHEVVEKLTSYRVLIQKQFISGIAAGLVAALGITIALSIAGAALGIVGQVAGGSVGEAARDAAETMQSKGQQPK